jgi:hypothetical protein
VKLVQLVEETKAGNGRLTWAWTEARMREADPVAHAAVLKLGGYSPIGRSVDREKTYRQAFRLAYVNEATGGSQQ